MTKLTMPLLLLCTALGLSAVEPAALAVNQSLIDAFVKDVAPADAKRINEVRTAGYKPGDTVIIRAQIGGRNPPWVPGHAIMLLADQKALKDKCTATCGAPWDFCSAPVPDLLANTCVVRWLDDEGAKPRQIGFADMAKIAPLSTVVVTGTVADVGDPKALVIDLDGFHLEDRGPFAALMDQQAATSPMQPAQ
ncbi:MAG: hypothetical protein PF961_04655 [Planctomycetota bacterium]|jgi:hypothetical protein|nr:hypothetical protein [Planctomycetota bacterium]